MKRIVIASSGASGADLSKKVIEKLPPDYEVHFIKTDNSDIVANKEQSLFCMKTTILPPLLLREVSKSMQ